MGTDYTAAITAVVALVLVLTAVTTYVFSRPSDLSPRAR
jgi:VIT1/CCC1 family predicted Fe2+/Mn2+ transporter